MEKKRVDITEDKLDIYTSFSMKTTSIVVLEDRTKSRLSRGDSPHGQLRMHHDAAEALIPCASTRH